MRKFNISRTSAFFAPALLLAALVLLTSLLVGQAVDGILVGTVTDSTGSAVPNATVTAT
jgi:hypothetical protein